MESALKNVDNTAEVLASSLIEGEKDLTVNCGNMGIRVEKTSKDGPRDKDVQTVNGAGVGMPSGVGREASIKVSCFFVTFCH